MSPSFTQKCRSFWRSTSEPSRTVNSVAKRDSYPLFQGELAQTSARTTATNNSEALAVAVCRNSCNGCTTRLGTSRSDRDHGGRTSSKASRDEPRAWIGRDRFGHDDSSRRPVFPAHLLRRHPSYPSRKSHADVVGEARPPPVGSARFGRWSARSHPFPEEAPPDRRRPRDRRARSGGDLRAVRRRRRSSHRPRGRRHPRDPRVRVRGEQAEGRRDIGEAEPSGRRRCRAGALDRRHAAARRALHRGLPRPGQLDGRGVRRRARVLLRRRPRCRRRPSSTC